MTTYTYNQDGKLLEVDISFSDRPVHFEPRKPSGKGNKLKMSCSAEMHRKPTHRSSKVIKYRVLEVS